ncbi:uncharacterized protein Z519_02233 [Cladophialophora bantiana CBS 173.52]|uniref:Enoyl reductase (ER) domain-containing protein n=1 Tax=Cladophialophora bantiana (strain ATCC 10958 / CBS 173.52 / CDC B-1940 / NIH 8579) TaxID=1442370 RepID=A0A0D2GEP8_CLAB1|nr:uncharacterized protein Z519_02233 [Cladophialophora bantiana CBS 173.52]KIW96842.1 hypothetical protein Z519_02233 [Cladophialophora bantiana CBS 173.52]
MRAQVLERFNAPYTFTTTHPEPPPPQGHELLVHVQAASYCHTDAVFASGAMQQGLPRVGSHEFSGVVEKMGPDAEKIAEAKGLKVGSLVGVPGRAFNACGQCKECTENDGDMKGYGVWCTRAGNLGLTKDGGFQEWCLVDVRQVARVPDVGNMRAVDIAPLMCAGVTVWNALETAGVDVSGGKENGEGKYVAILGAGGGLGHLGVQFAARLGWNVVAVDTTPAMGMLKEVVEGLGEDGKRVTTVDVLKESVDDAKKRIFGEAEKGLEGEKGCDSSIILPESQAAFDFGMSVLKNHGTCVCVSFPKDGWKFKPGDLVFRHIKLLGVLTGRNRQLQAMVDFAAKTGVRAKIRTYPLEKLNELVEDYHRGVGGKLVVDMEMKP